MVNAQGVSPSQVAQLCGVEVVQSCVFAVLWLRKLLPGQNYDKIFSDKMMTKLIFCARPIKITFPKAKSPRGKLWKWLFYFRKKGLKNCKCPVPDCLASTGADRAWPEGSTRPPPRLQGPDTSGSAETPAGCCLGSSTARARWRNTKSRVIASGRGIREKEISVSRGIREKRLASAEESAKND